MSEKLNNVVSTLTGNFKLSKSEIRELQIKEDLFASFLKFTLSRPSDIDCDHFKKLDVRTMSNINDLLKTGFAFEDIKGYTIWLKGE
ncbi:hypothetical protein M8998_07330 [Sphingobacterium sp. lm-10]|uniref:hypothetical protein n=1 Tax=Sphingobacterium sp. lm-10 TaxID=2944904 RepID=UPI00201FCCC2|nr:hypothetical protein [Sphingobacterium sp. lm-10]MCL7987746.1 hypothetical protein [Sphingobacterium sp. lm-10]